MDQNLPRRGDGGEWRAAGLESGVDARKPLLHQRLQHSLVHGGSPRAWGPVWSTLTAGVLSLNVRLDGGGKNPEISALFIGGGRLLIKTDEC